jgi:plastocyanin
VVLGLILALLAPALAIAADPEPPPADPPELTASNVSPNAALTAATGDDSATLDASASTDPDGTIELFEWDLDGDGVYEEQSGTEAILERELPPGTTLVAGVRVLDDAGAADEATASVTMPAPPPAEPAAKPPEPKATQPQLITPAALAETPEPRPAKPRKRRQRSTKSDEPAIRTVASRSVTISDFEFGPATVNIDVGDTVTWNNRGPTVHTATANDGSFDSGTLDRGENYSKTFSSAGTFSYICTPHPFMTGRVVVGGAGADGGGGGGGSGGGGSSGGGGGGSSGGDDTEVGTAGSSDDTTAGGLANTGADLIPWSLFGLSLFAFGAAMRLRLTAE